MRLENVVHLGDATARHARALDRNTCSGLDRGSQTKHSVPASILAAILDNVQAVLGGTDLDCSFHNQANIYQDRAKSDSEGDEELLEGLYCSLETGGAPLQIAPSLSRPLS
jgi:hypothetical protein